MNLRERFPGISDARVLVASALAVALTVPPNITVAAWADETRMVSAESGSPAPGKWSNSLTPYVIEPMECLSPSHPATDVTLKWCAQSAKTEVGVNFVGHMIDVDPSGMLIALPSIDEAQKFAKLKLQPAIDATPALKHKVKEVKSRDESGSTASFKRFRGGFVQITHTGSSKGLQSITVKRLWGDEISEYPHDAGGRGDPIEQMRQRSSTFVLLGAKHLWTSTPKVKGDCRISDFYEASDQRRLYWKCPHCGDWFLFRFEHLKWDRENKPFGAYIETPCCHAVVEHWRKRDMLATCVWIKTFPASDDGDFSPGDVVEAGEIETYKARKSYGRQPGFHLWRGQSAFSDWDSIVEKFLEAKDSTTKLKTFTQQVLAEAFEEAGEAPDYLKLMARREDRERDFMPDGVLALTGMCDVQNNRLEWGVYGWGEKMSCWLVDGGMIPGDPEDDATWSALAEVTTRLYTDQYGRSWPIEAFGVDSGFKSHIVYNFVRRRPNVYATDGRDGATRPFVGTPRKVDINWRGKIVRGGAMLWPLGTYPLKSALYASLQKTIDGPDATTGIWPAGSIRFPKDCDEAFFLQITAEYLKTVETREGITRRVWVKRPGQANEQLDIWVGARAMASQIGLDRYTPEKWAYRVALHAPPQEGGADDLWASAERAEETAAVETLAAKDRRKSSPEPVLNPQPKRRIIQSRYMGE